jgi:hypothetical protein
MGDDDDGLAVVPHRPQHRKQRLGLLRSQYRSRLIQNQDVGAAEQHLHDLQGLLFGDRHLVYFFIQVDGKAVTAQDLLGFGPGALQIAAFRLLQPQDDVLQGGEHIDKLEMLMNHADAQRVGVMRAADADRLPVDQDPAGIGVIDACQHIHYGRLAAAVFPQQGQYFMPADVKAHRVVGPDRTERLADILQLYGAEIAHGVPFQPAREDGDPPLPELPRSVRTDQ